ncbi:MAG: hypothetical protein HY455_02765 [Parcubacteria group bacterium]|nr:hypothetical protein [Parcubacteria group bacterium]
MSFESASPGEEEGSDAHESPENKLDLFVGQTISDIKLEGLGDELVITTGDGRKFKIDLNDIEYGTGMQFAEKGGQAELLTQGDQIEKKLSPLVGQTITAVDIFGSMKITTSDGTKLRFELDDAEGGGPAKVRIVEKDGKEEDVT